MHCRPGSAHSVAAGFSRGKRLEFLMGEILMGQYAVYGRAKERSTQLFSLVEFSGSERGPSIVCPLVLAVFR